jgi:hypothetical protein
MNENEKMRELLEEARDAVKRSMGAWTWAGYEDHTTDEKALLERIDATLSEPPEQKVTPDWACYDCGSTDGFHTVQHHAGDYDVECGECGSAHTDESSQVLRKLVRDLDTVQAERDEAKAEIERLKWDLEMACENTPTEGCECPGCETARERAEKGET